MSGIPGEVGAPKNACAASWLWVWLLSWLAAAVFCEFIIAITSWRSIWICWTWASAISYAVFCLKKKTQFGRYLAPERPLKDIRDEYNYANDNGIKHACSRLLEASTMHARRR